MIAPEQLAAALERLDPRDWEVLDLSLRRRVPDEALAKIFECGPAEVARRRAFAIERLVDDLGIQRGEDVGEVLKALLEPRSWETAEGSKAKRAAWEGFEDQDEEAGAERERGEPESEPPDTAKTEPGDPPAFGRRARRPTELKSSEAARLFRVPPEPEPFEPRVAPEPVAGPETGRIYELAHQREQAERAEVAEQPVEEPAEEERAEGERAEGERPERADRDAHAERAGQDAEQHQEPQRASAAERRGASATAQAVPVLAPTNGSPRLRAEPVLDMLADREHERRRERLRMPFLVALGAGLGAVGLFAAGFVGATVLGDGNERSAGGDEAGPRHFVPDLQGPLAAPFPSDPSAASCYATAYVRRAVSVHKRPGGRRALRLAARTEWDSPRVFSVVRRRGEWLAVLAPELKNGEIGWIRSKGARLDCVRWSVHVDLSRRRLYVRRDGRTQRRLDIAIGSPKHPTPKGRFAVTDKLKVTDKGSPYGCCVLALSGHQTRLPADWPGGDRLAVHATSDLSSIGKRISLGCMRSRPKQVSWLIRTVPLGTPVFIRT